MGVSGELGVSWAVCLAPVSQTAGVWCKSFPCPPLCQRQLQPWGHHQLQQLCPLASASWRAASPSLRPTGACACVHVCLGAHVCGQSRGLRGRMGSAGFLEHTSGCWGGGGRLAGWLALGTAPGVC